MISNTVYSKGKDDFKDYTFSAREWSAPTMVSPKEIRERIDSFALCGRKIKCMRLIGLSYFHTSDWVKEAAYRQFEHLPEDERRRRSNYPTIDPTMQFSRYAQIDEPLLIEFEDGDIFEIETPQDPEFRMSMNCIPWWIKAETNQPNVEANILFSPCIGQEIVSVEVNTRITDKDPMFFCAFNEPPYQRELVFNVTIRLGNGLGLQISPDIDYCEVACVDANNEWVNMSFPELKDALFNWEDIHNDEITGFEAESHMLFFGRKGAAYAETPYMTIYSSSKDTSRLHVYVEDFLVLDWSISLAIGSCFNEYGEYHFSHKEWHDLLNEAWRILVVDDFDALFDELIERQGKGNYMMWKLNSQGAYFWKERDKYRTQIKDIREWSNLVLGFNDTMDIYGF